MAEKRAYKQYSNEFKEDVISLARDQGYSVAKAAESVGIKPSLLYKWKEKIELELTAKSLDPNERDEPKRLRKEVKELRMEKEILKKTSAFFAKEMK
jgi:transposase